jgi:hypothetical protein
MFSVVFAKKGGLSAASIGFAWAGQQQPRAFKLHEHPVVDPHVSHFMQVPFRTKVKFPHSEHISPS